MGARVRVCMSVTIWGVHAVWKENLKGTTVHVCACNTARGRRSGLRWTV